MSQAAEIARDLEFVEADLSYVVDDGQPSVRYVDWPEEAHKAHLPTYEAHRMRIWNGRTAGEHFSLPTHGFEMVTHETTVRDFYDEDEVLRVYYPEVEALIKRESGAQRVVVFDHTIRTPDVMPSAGSARR